MPDWLQIVTLCIAVATPMAAWLGRTLFQTWLDGRIKTKSAKEIEKLKSELDRERQSLSDLRNSVLSGQAARQAMFDQKRLEAIEKLWLSVQKADKLHMAPTFLQAIKLDEASKLIADDQNIQKYFSVVNSFIPELPKADDEAMTAFEDPMVPQDIWVAYGAYISIITSAYVVIYSLANGIDIQRFMKHDYMKDRILKAMPYFSEFLEEHGYQGAYYLAESSRQNLVKSIRAFVSGEEADEKQLLKAAELTVKGDEAYRASMLGLKEGLPDIPANIKES